MKNIHVLPTEKPSMVIKSKHKKTYYLYSIEEFKDIENFREYDSKNWDSQHIYITSDEEIKEGYAFHLKTQEVLKLKGVGEKSKEIFHSKGFSYPEECEKIILTTDQDLIKDGVQSIDDEFLEWVVKNPSCEFVGVEKYHGINTSIAEVNAISGDGSLNWEGKSDLRDYKIIIPKEDWLLNNPQCKQIESCSKSLSKKCICTKEEPTLEEEYLKDELKKYDGIDVVVLNKQEFPKQNIIDNWLEKNGDPEIHKQVEQEAKELCEQETLEEAAKNFYPPITTDLICSPKLVRDAFIVGAKWQQEQIGKSEFLQRLRATISDAEARRLIFEQFKKE
jgi:hypothetical protein